MILAEIADQLAESAFKILCLFARHHAAGAAGPVAAEGPAALGAGALVLFAHANSSFDSWLSAISR